MGIGKNSKRWGKIGGGGQPEMFKTKGYIEDLTRRPSSKK